MILSENLTDFMFRRNPALGFCPPLDEIFSATISRRDDGHYVAALSVLEPTTADDPDCLPFFFLFTECAKEVALPERNLSTEEVATLRATFSAVQVFEVRDPICDVIVIDPCVVNVLSWTRAVGDVTSPDRVTFSLNDEPHATRRLPRAEVHRIAAVLDGLR